MTSQQTLRTTRETAESTPETTEDALPLDVVYGLLSNQRRRRTLRYLQSEPETTLGDLAEHVASLETDKPVRELSAAERKRVYICLYQCHLPKMDDADAIHFDEARKVIRSGENAEQVLRYLPRQDPDASEDGSDSLSTAVIGAAAIVGQRLPIAR